LLCQLLRLQLVDQSSHLLQASLLIRVALQIKGLRTAELTSLWQQWPVMPQVNHRQQVAAGGVQLLLPPVGELAAACC
jgi:hypothetical protein